MLDERGAGVVKLRVDKVEQMDKLGPKWIEWAERDQIGLNKIEVGIVD